MGFLDDVKVNAQAFAHCAGTKASKLAELTRIKVNIAGVNRTLNEKFVLAGRKAYREKIKGTPAEDLDGLYEEITQLLAKRRALEQQVEQLKKISVCPECGTENPSTATYCVKCGEKL